jgi:MFS family permease
MLDWEIANSLMFWWNASGYTTVQDEFPTYLGTSMEVAVLPLTLYVFGLTFGPMTLAPLSEYYGRTPIYLISLVASMLFVLATALVPDASGFIILRFIAGVLLLCGN